MKRLVLSAFILIINLLCRAQSPSVFEYLQNATELTDEAYDKEPYEAIPLLEKAIEMWHNVPTYMEEEEYARTLNFISHFEALIENKEAAIRYSHEELIVRQNINDPDTIITISNLVTNYSSFSDSIYLEKALYYNTIVLQHRLSTLPPNHYSLSITYRNMARIYIRKNDFISAITNAKQSAIIAKNARGEKSKEYAMSLSCLGAYYANADDYSNSLYYFQKAYYAYPDDYGNLFNVASAFARIGVPDSSCYYLNVLLDAYVKQFVSNVYNLDEKHKAFYLNNNVSRHFLEQIINEATYFPNHKGLQILALESALVLENLGITSEQFKNNHDMIIHKDGLYYERQWDNIRNSLRDREIAVDYFYANPRDSIMSVFLIRKDWDSPRIVMINILQAFRMPSDDNDTKQFPLYDTIWKEVLENGNVQEGERIYVSPDGILNMMPIEAICDYDGKYMCERFDIHRVSSLHRITETRVAKPFKSIALYGGLAYDAPKDSLVRESYKSLIDESLMPDSISDEMRSKVSFLPWTVLEVDSIKSLMNDNNIHVNERKGYYGTEESVWNMSGNSPDIIHFATHGFYKKDNIIGYSSMFEYENLCMDNCGLLLSGALCSNEDDNYYNDGILSGNDIRKIDLSGTDLVILSACNTADGGLLTSDGIWGLQRAFKIAGANTIIMSVREIDDAATYFFMMAFYKALILTGNKHEAFCIARNELKNSEQFSDFFIWSSFIMLD